MTIGHWTLGVSEIYKGVNHLINKPKNLYNFKKMSKKLRKQFIKDLQIFGKVNTYKRKTNTTYLIYFPKVITDILAHILDIKFTYPDKFPNRLFNTAKQCKKSFLQALYDDEGTISTNLSIYIYA